jgi:hypothetical protein
VREVNIILYDAMFDVCPAILKVTKDTCIKFGVTGVIINVTVPTDLSETLCCDGNRPCQATVELQEL